VHQSAGTYRGGRVEVMDESEVCVAIDAVWSRHQRLAPKQGK